MRVYELMEKLARLPAGAEVKTSIFICEDMDLFAEESERTLHAAVADVDFGCDIAYLDTSDAEVQK